MKQIACEICKSADLMKKDGIIVCRHCGAKYSAQEIKNIMFEENDRANNVMGQDDNKDVFLERRIPQNDYKILRLILGGIALILGGYLLYNALSTYFGTYDVVVIGFNALFVKSCIFCLIGILLVTMSISLNFGILSLVIEKFSNKVDFLERLISKKDYKILRLISGTLALILGGYFLYNVLSAYFGIYNIAIGVNFTFIKFCIFGLAGVLLIVMSILLTFGILNSNENNKKKVL
ncbi:MAG: hypothetical protein LBN20_01310 [Endomicrobium sp.]|jgi:hypothetical protein|nr:hypothetical protein [Endomicrobium sp.]